MDLRKLKKLIDLVQESGIAELEITEGEEKVRISRAGNAVQTAVMTDAPGHDPDGRGAGRGSRSGSGARNARRA